ncbi:MAG: dethiobiotin synthase [Spirochaetia bacterium]|nr:dethiobiotin synthase [Spirochaetia bacterium]
MKNDIFITGIDTNIGKTITAAIFTEALKADYFKPVQSGNLKNTDRMTVEKLVSNSKSIFHNEIYKFKEPLSPHAAAKKENIIIDPSKILRPASKNRLIIEGAGGLLVPLTSNHLMIDLIKDLQCDTVIVSKNYLGSINHTLLTIEILKSKKIPVLGIVFSGKPNEDSENFILRYTNCKKLLHIHQETIFNKNIIIKYAQKLKKNKELLK